MDLIRLAVCKDSDLGTGLAVLGPRCVEYPQTTSVVGATGLILPDATQIVDEARRACIGAARRGELKPDAPYLRNCHSSTVQPTRIAEAPRGETSPFALNTREVALFVWGAIFLAWVFRKAADVRSSVGAVLASVFGTVLIWVLVFALLYTGAIVLALMYFGYWEPPMMKLTAWWFLGTAVSAIFASPTNSARYFRRLVVHNLTLYAVLEFLTELYTFPLLIELAFVPIVAILVAMQAFSETRTEYGRASSALKGCSALVGWTVLIFVLYQAFIHRGEIVSPAKAREFLLPLILMTAFVPYLYTWRYVMAMQTVLSMTKFGLREDKRLFSFARDRIIRAVGFSLKRAELFESRYRGRLWGVTTRTDVLRVLGDFAVESKLPPEDSQNERAQI